MRSQHGESDGQDSPIVLGPDSNCQIKDNLCCYCSKTSEMAKEGNVCRLESNPGPLGYAGSTLPLSQILFDLTISIKSSDYGGILYIGLPCCDLTCYPSRSTNADRYQTPISTVITKSRVIKGEESGVAVSGCHCSVAEHWQLSSS